MELLGMVASRKISNRDLFFWKKERGYESEVRNQEIGRLGVRDKVRGKP